MPDTYHSASYYNTAAPPGSNNTGGRGLGRDRIALADMLPLSVELVVLFKPGVAATTIPLGLLLMVIVVEDMGVRIMVLLKLEIVATPILLVLRLVVAVMEDRLLEFGVLVPLVRLVQHLLHLLVGVLGLLKLELKPGPTTSRHPRAESIGSASEFQFNDDDTRPLVHIPVNLARLPLVIVLVLHLSVARVNPT